MAICTNYSKLTQGRNSWSIINGKLLSMMYLQDAHALAIKHLPIIYIANTADAFRISQRQVTKLTTPAFNISHGFRSQSFDG
jgi:hypothetical protein